MSYRVAHNALRDRFAVQWANALPVAWPNVSFTVPSPASSWCRFNISDTIDDIAGSQISIGGRTNINRYTGTIIVQLFGPLDKGNGALLGHADTILGIFGNWGGVNIQCRRGFIKDIGPDGNGFYQINVVVPFVRNEII